MVSIKVTLEDIAKTARVAASTVYRAINNLPGVSEVKRQEILEIAEEIGYVKNYHASSLKKGSQTFAIVLPEEDDINFFATYLRRGAETFVKESKNVQITIKQLPYKYAPEDLSVRLSEIVEGNHGDLDGMLCFGSLFQEPLELLKKIKEKNIPVVHVISDSKKEYRLTTVMPNAIMAGKMVADQLIEFNRNRDYSKVLVIGDFRGTNQYYNSLGFEQQIWESRQPLEIIKITNESGVPQAQVKAIVERTLTDIEGIGAIYCCNARGTIPMCEAVAELGLSQSIYTIGSDVFPESIKAVKNSTLTALLHNRPTDVSSRAMEILLDYTVQGIIPEDNVKIAPIIVTRSNIDYYAAENQIII